MERPLLHTEMWSPLEKCWIFNSSGGGFWAGFRVVSVSLESVIVLESLLLYTYTYRTRGHASTNHETCENWLWIFNKLRKSAAALAALAAAAPTALILWNQFPQGYWLRSPVCIWHLLNMVLHWVCLLTWRCLFIIKHPVLSESKQLSVTTHFVNWSHW